MAISEALLPEFDRKWQTRKVLERVPGNRFEWRPHQKSGTMGWLAGDLANLPSWVQTTINCDELDLAPGGKAPEPPTLPTSTTELLASFDKNAAEARTRSPEPATANL